MKKFNKMMMVALLSMSILAGCGKAAEKKPEAPAEKVAETSKEETKDEVKSTSDFDVNNEITVLSREDGSGTRGAFTELLGIIQKDDDGNKKDLTTKEAVIAKQTDLMIKSVADDVFAIGYISLGSLNDMVKAVSIDGAEPSSENVQSGKYSVVRPFNIAIKNRDDALVNDFIAYILSSEGQAVISKSYIAVDDAAAAFESEKPAGKIVIAGSSSVTPIMEKLVEAYKAINTDAVVEIQQSDSSAGMISLVDGNCDIAMVSRDLKDSEKDGVEGIQIAIDGIAVIVNGANPLDNLTKDQVKSIFIGETLEWADVVK